MSTPYPHPGPVGPDTLITVKVFINGENRRFKLALRDLGAHVLPQKLRFLLQVPADADVKFDRFSDSAGTYVTLDASNPAIFKQLYRAAKAKLKLRLKATVITADQKDNTSPTEDKIVPESSKRNTYLETVLSNPPSEPVYPVKPLQPNVVSLGTTSIQPTMEMSTQPALSRPTLPTLNDFCGTTFSIDCNHCGESVSNEHYHCGKCEMGDFDLCPTCINRGVTCDGEDHWLIKRAVKNGKVYASNTETLPPKKKLQAHTIPVEPTVEEDQRTCNSCIIQLGASSFVTCQQCADFDLCFFCLEHGEHGHHPAHTFVPVDATSAAVTPYIKTLCQQGRGLKHDAVCDGCDAQIMGVRHKCLTCPDFDYCSTCIHVAAEVHPGHRFGPIYEQLGMIHTKKEQHRGIYCDGPICTARARKSYIRGDRYKCAICHDTDFCANCEALPSNPHNKTHPLIKLRTPVRQLSVAAHNDVDNGPTAALGDRHVPVNASTETTRPSSANAATQVQTVAETTPIEHKQEVVKKTSVGSPADLQAWFESESTPDGTCFLPNRLVHQSWTLRNPGPNAWPAGCAVHFIGGDEMRNLDDKHPSPVSSMTIANRSNTLTAPLEPGKTQTFSVILRSPAREGRAISYWRLKTDDGMPFGHKLWCDINITNNISKPVEAPAAVPVEAPVEAPVEKEEPVVEADKSQDSSQMIFPKLEKESPESSIDNIKQEAVPVEPSVAALEDQDLLDDLDSMTLEDESTEDGFFTDEEYDILDAEDEEYLANAQRATQK
ncbi:hypothetical protein OHC33_001089 [Knufia fluminis]|uniref:ZZ-type domain-containing protein n=1 Tax=Knufia fluminis TaxID=191047 RepID=A0AAN8EWS1_9EURO|nr:hypothetical protein OHC33_001089 [Knufia fluminis]